MIPRKIHYCWFGPKPLPNIVLTCLQTWKEVMPEYELIFWNENNSPMHVPFIKQAYSVEKYAFVSDYVRLWALYNHGGIYMDTDMYVVRPFGDLLNNEIFFSWEAKSNRHIGCCTVGALPGQQFIGNLIDHYNNLEFTIDTIPDLVIPRVVKNCFDDYPLKNEITIFPYDYFYPFPYEEKENVKNFRKYLTENTYAVHLWNISWGSWKDKLRDRVLYNLRNWRRAI